MDAARARQCGNPHRRRASCNQRTAGGAHGSSRGENVIDHQNVFARDCFGIGHAKGIAHVEATLARCKPSLAAGCAMAHQHPGCQGEAPPRVRCAQGAKSLKSEKLRLIETSPPALAAMQRHRNNEQFARRVGVQLSDCVGEHLPQAPRCRMKLLILEGVHRFAHSAGVGSVGNGTHKGRRGEAAGTTERPFGRGLAKRCMIKRSPIEHCPIQRCPVERNTVDGVTAAGADESALDGNFSPAGITNWHRGKARQRGAAEGARSRKEGATDSIKGTSKNAGNRSPA